LLSPSAEVAPKTVDRGIYSMLSCPEPVRGEDKISREGLSVMRPCSRNRRSTGPQEITIWQSVEQDGYSSE